MSVHPVHINMDHTIDLLDTCGFSAVLGVLLLGQPDIMYSMCSTAAESVRSSTATPCLLPCQKALNPSSSRRSQLVSASFMLDFCHFFLLHT